MCFEQAMFKFNLGSSSPLPIFYWLPLSPIPSSMFPNLFIFFRCRVVIILSIPLHSDSIQFEIAEQFPTSKKSIQFATFKFISLGSIKAIAQYNIGIKYGPIDGSHWNITITSAWIRKEGVCLSLLCTTYSLIVPITIVFCVQKSFLFLN